MITTNDIKTNTWADYIEAGVYKTTFLKLYENKPPKMSEFDLVGFSDLLRHNNITLSLFTKNVSDSARHNAWGGYEVAGVRVELRLTGVSFYTANFWYDPDEKEDTRKMKSVTETYLKPEMKRMLTIDGALTTSVATMSMTEVAPIIVR